jgi:hypothetical protein
LGVVAIGQRVLNHCGYCDGRESDERKQTAHGDDDAALEVKYEREERFI